jgi:hypothetical protein
MCSIKEKISRLVYFFVFLMLGLSACKDEENLEDARRALITAHEWKGDEFDTKIDVSPALVLVFLDISADDLEFGEPIPLLSVKFENGGTFTGTDLEGQSINGLWSLQDSGQKIQLTGFNFAIPEAFIPPALLAVIPEGTSLADLLPDVYEIVELTDTKFTIQSSNTTQISQNPDLGIPITVEITPRLDIFLVK